MNKKYPEAVRHAIIEVYNRGTSVTQLSMEYSIPRSTVYSWLRKSQSTAFHQENAVCPAAGKQGAKTGGTNKEIKEMQRGMPNAAKNYGKAYNVYTTKATKFLAQQKLRLF